MQVHDTESEFQFGKRKELIEHMENFFKYSTYMTENSPIDHTVIYANMHLFCGLLRNALHRQFINHQIIVTNCYIYADFNRERIQFKVFQPVKSGVS